MWAVPGVYPRGHSGPPQGRRAPAWIPGCLALPCVHLGAATCPFPAACPFSWSCGQADGQALQLVHTLAGPAIFDAFHVNEEVFPSTLAAGIDIAFIFDGTAYHTSRDDIDRIRPGTLQARRGPPRPSWPLVGCSLLEHCQGVSPDTSNQAKRAPLLHAAGGRLRHACSGSRRLTGATRAQGGAFRRADVTWQPQRRRRLCALCSSFLKRSRKL